MKKIFTFFAALFVFTAFIHAQTPGELTVTATTSTAGGNYAPRNIVAVWIEDDQGNFVKTLMAYAQTRRTHLNTWEASTTAAGSPFNTVDAVTGPTRNSHDTRTCSWDASDVDGNIVADGTYFVWMELTDKNGTGNFSSFSFEKGLIPVNLTPLNVPSFSSISIDWEPIFTSVSDNNPDPGIKVYPNPTSGIVTIEEKDILEVTIRDASGQLVVKSYHTQVDLSNHPDGIYFLKITARNSVSFRKIIKSSF